MVLGVVSEDVTGVLRAAIRAARAAISAETQHNNTHMTCASQHIPIRMCVCACVCAHVCGCVLVWCVGVVC